MLRYCRSTATATRTAVLIPGSTNGSPSIVDASGVFQVSTANTYIGHMLQRLMGGGRAWYMLHAAVARAYKDPVAATVYDGVYHTPLGRFSMIDISFIHYKLP